MVGGGTKMPAVIRMVRTLTGIDPKRTIDPDEAVALGAAIQVDMLSFLVMALNGQTRSWACD